MRETRYDVVVSGGGPAGAVCALGLARLGRRVLLADHPRSPGRDEGGADLPTPEMLTPDGAALLDRLGLGRALDGGASTPCRGVVSYWEDGEPDFTDLELVRLRPGRTLDRARFDENLRGLAGEAGVEIRRPARVRFLGTFEETPVRFRLEAGDREPAGPEWTASFAVEATGRGRSDGASALAHARRLQFDRLVAVVLPMTSGTPRDGLLRVAPAASGWWYTVPPAGSRGGVAVYLTDGDLLPREPRAFADLLDRERAEAPALAIGPIPPMKPRPRDARTGCRRVLQRGRWVPIGDAASSLDPLSGSGLTRGLQMAERAAEAIDRCLSEDDPGPVAKLALDACHEFLQVREAGLPLYRRCARRFPASEFWQRRRDP